MLNDNDDYKNGYLEDTSDDYKLGYIDEKEEPKKDKAITYEEEIEKREQKRKDGIFFILYIIFLLCIAFLIVKFVGQRSIIIGSSMNNTLRNKDNVIIDKITYKLSKPKRFEIIIFPDKRNKSVSYVKRIIGLPGETINIDKSGNIYINGKLLKENYGKDIIIDPGRAIKPITLAKDEYFVMGDNRNNSEDSRFNLIGNVHRRNIVGRVIFRFYPFNQMRGLLP